jgi:hypothetical protein
MKQKIAVTLDEELVAFLDSVAEGNRSDYLNTLLTHHRKQLLEAQLIAALQSDAQDLDYQQEVADWDSIAAGGIESGKDD